MIVISYPLYYIELHRSFAFIEEEKEKKKLIETVIRDELMKNSKKRYTKKKKTKIKILISFIYLLIIWRNSEFILLIIIRFY